MAATVAIGAPDREHTASGLLVAISDTHAVSLRADAEKFRQAAVWADLHPVDPIDEAATVPGAPTAVAATAGNGAASVTWTAPASPGTSAITGYTVQAFNGTAAVGTPLGVAATARAASVAGLTNGTSYTVQVKAVSAAGASAPGVSNAVVPRAPALPGTPTGVTAARGNASATVHWVAPTTGAAVTGYQVKVSAGGLQVGALRTAASTARSLLVTGLTNGTTYSVQVRATSAGGAGALSAAVSVRPLTTPSAPVSTRSPAFKWWPKPATLRASQIAAFKG